MKPEIVLARLAVEYWKLLRSFERIVESAPLDARTRLSAQVRYAANRLEGLLLDANMKVVSFDGVAFEVNLPAIAINGEDLVGLDNLVVEQTIEPAIVSDMTVLLMGKVLLEQSTKLGSEQDVSGH
jgi:hypothetical protein